MTSSTKLFLAVDDAAFGKSSYKHSENYVERTARVRVFSYCFLCFTMDLNFTVLKQQVKTYRDIHLRQTVPCPLYFRSWDGCHFLDPS